LIEVGQIDETDLLGSELAQLAHVIQRSVSWLVSGQDQPVVSLQQGIVAQRSRGGTMQQQLSFDTNTCPDCHHLLDGVRCSNCGRSPE
jgi:hypothetical protein